MNTEQEAPNPRCKCGMVLVLVGHDYASCPDYLTDAYSQSHLGLMEVSPELKHAIRVADLPQAILFKGIRATNLRDPINPELPDGKKTCGVGLYCVADRPGLWRRVSRQVKTGGQFLLAATPAGQIWQFVRWDAMGKELPAVLGLHQANETAEEAP